VLQWKLLNYDSFLCTLYHGNTLKPCRRNMDPKWMMFFEMLVSSTNFKMGKLRNDVSWWQNQAWVVEYTWRKLEMWGSSLEQLAWDLLIVGGNQGMENLLKCNQGWRLVQWQHCLGQRFDGNIKLNTCTCIKILESMFIKLHIATSLRI
jgi:hypothetical protein